MVVRSLMMALMLTSAGAALAEPSVQMIAVEPGVELRTTDAGTANGDTPVVLIPGWGTSADIWAEQAARLARHRRVV